MDIKTLKEITKLMKDNDLVEVEIESDQLKVRLKKACAAVTQVVATLPAAPAAIAAPAAPAAAPAPAGDDPSWKKVISPIPGTAYLKPNPDAQNFVGVGTQVDENKVVCLVEAMKVFNEIKPEAGIRGQIKKVCVTDGQPVEYGTVLFLVG